MKSSLRSITRRASLAALAGLALGLGQSAWADGKPLRIVTEEMPPYNMTEDGRVIGLSTEVVEAVLKEVGLDAPIQSMPWARAYDIALNTENVLIYSITRLPEREKLFKWIGVVAPMEWALWAQTSRPVALSHLNDAKKYQIASVNADAGEQYLLARGFTVGVNLQPGNKQDVGYEKLRLGRVDLWIAPALLASHVARQAGDDPRKELTPVLNLRDVSASDGFHMAFSSQTPDELVERFRKGLATIKQNGTFDAIKKKWL